VPRKLAESRGVFPVVWDAKTDSLSIVTADPGDHNALQEVQIAAGGKS
jgi:hypothetical protein